MLYCRRLLQADILPQKLSRRKAMVIFFGSSGVAWTSTDGTTHAGVVTFHRLADARCRVTVQIDWQPQGMVEKAGSMLGVENRQVTADLNRFKQFIESRGRESGQWRGDIGAGGAGAGTEAGS